MIHTEPDDFERKRHYQMLKAQCLRAASYLQHDTEEEHKDLAKRLFRWITEERWGSEPVEEPSDG